MVHVRKTNLASKDTMGGTFRRREHMVWQPEIDEINRRVEFAGKMGGQTGIDVQHGRGKLTIRERLDLFCDEGTFQEIGRLAGAATYEDNDLVDVRPSNTLIGTCTVNGRKVVLNGGDFTVRGGAADAAIGNKGGHAQNMARDWRLPYIRLYFIFFNVF